MGHAVGVHVTVGKEDTIFMIAADAGSMSGHCKIDDGWGGRALGDEVAGEDEVVGAGLVLDFC